MQRSISAGIIQGVAGMTYISYIPSPPLNTYIEDLYYLDGPAAYPRQKVLPVASANLMINLGNAFNVYEPDQARPFMTCTDSWWVGIWNTYHSVDWPPNVQLFGVHFKPGGAYPFLGLPLSEMNSQVVPLSALWGHGAGEIRERLHAAPTIQAGFALLEKLLLVRLCEAPYSLSMVQHAIAEIDHRHGALSIRALSDQIGISQNYLSTQFKQFVGVPPKEVARFYRFAHALRLIDVAQRVDLTRIAHQSQFYDQSHFNKDFVAFTGLSPSEYVQLRRRVEAENPEYTRVLPINLPIG
jgi:AraC-like DNA-binding protein